MELGSPSPGRVFLILLLAGAALYATHFDNSFQFDDFHSIVQNPSIRGFGSWRSWFTDLSSFSVLPENLNYRPLLLATYALSYRISGLEVWGFHLLNWLIHVAVSFLVYAIALRLFSYGRVHAVRLGPYFGLYPPAIAAMALFAALIHLVHPRNSEPVNYISSRSESLAAGFVLLAFLLYLERERALGAGHGRRALACMLASAAAFACGLLTKEIAVTFPALVLLHDLLLARHAEKPRRPAERVIFYALIGTLAASYLLLREQLIPDTVVAARSTVGRTTYFLTQIRAWVHYVWEFLWPARLTTDNTDFGWSTAPGDPRVQFAVLVLAGLAITVKAGMHRHRLYAFGMIWYLVTVLPTSSFFPLAEPVNEHRPYLPGVGLNLAATILLFSFVTRPGRLGDVGRQGFLCAFLGVAGTLLVLGTLERNRVWDSPRSLWSDVVAKSPGNGRAHMNLGLALSEGGDLEGAARHFDLAVERAPAYALAYINRANLRRARGDSAGATADVEKALRLGPANIFVLYWAGKHYLAAGNLARAAEHLERARIVSPRHPESLRLLLDVDARSGRAERLPGHLAALDSLGIATDEDRQTVAYHLLLARRHGDAIPILENLLRRLPDDPRARFNLGFAHLALGRYADAEREFRKVVAGDPRRQDAWQNLLWIHRATGDRAAHDRTAAEMQAALGGTGGAPGFRAVLPPVVGVPSPAGVADIPDRGQGAAPRISTSVPARADTGRARVPSRPPRPPASG